MGKIQELGLKRYLDNTKALHKRLGYSTFVSMVTATDPRVERQEIADAFGVSRYTIYEWIKVYEQEQKNHA